MRGITVFIAIALLSSSLFGQKRVSQFRFSYGKAITWNNDSIAPFKVYGKFIQMDKIYEIPGKKKNELFNSAIDYFTSKYGYVQDLFKSLDLEAGKAATSFKMTGEYYGRKYEISESWFFYAKDGKLRIVCSINHLTFGIIEVNSLFSKDEELIMIDGDAIELYPLAPPKKKKPNFWECAAAEILRKEMTDAQIVASEILESVENTNSDW